MVIEAHSILRTRGTPDQLRGAVAGEFYCCDVHLLQGRTRKRLVVLVIDAGRKS